MKAADLPYDVKQKLLEQIEQQVGWSQYRKMVDAVGEDGLIDLALGKAEEIANSQANVKKQEWWDKHGWWVGAAIWLIAGVLFWAIGGKKGLEVFYIIWLIGFVVLPVIGSFFKWLSR
ncbi:MAG: hypothetical protein AB7U82_13540 [Blastocatellales bacterium]